MGAAPALKSTCQPASRRCRGPGRLLQQPLPVPKGGLCLRLEHMVPHLPARQNAGRFLLIPLRPLTYRPARGLS